MPMNRIDQITYKYNDALYCAAMLGGESGEIAYDLAHASETIEPLLLLVVGAIVLILALGVFLPLWDMTYQISHKS